MTEVGWNLTDLEFKVLCDEYRRGRLPAPFSFVSRIADAARYEAECARLRTLVRGTTTPEFIAMTAVLTRPDVFVVARSWHDAAYDDPARHIRQHAILRGDAAYLITQRPGETVGHSGGFDIVRHDRATVVEALFAAFPAVGPGTGAPLPAAGTARSPYLEAPADATGFVKVLDGARAPDGTRREVGLMWRDLPGDGRYALPLHEPAPAGLPLGAAQLAAWVKDRIAEAAGRL